MHVVGKRWEARLGMWRCDYHGSDRTGVSVILSRSIINILISPGRGFSSSDPHFGNANVCHCEHQLIDAHPSRISSCTKYFTSHLHISLQDDDFSTSGYDGSDYSMGHLQLIATGR